MGSPLRAYRRRRPPKTAEPVVVAAEVARERGLEPLIRFYIPDGSTTPTRGALVVPGATAEDFAAIEAALERQHRRRGDPGEPPRPRWGSREEAEEAEASCGQR